MKWIVVRKFNSYEIDVEVFTDKVKAQEFIDGWKNQDYTIEKIYMAEVNDEWDHPLYGGSK